MEGGITYYPARPQPGYYKRHSSNNFIVLNGMLPKFELLVGALDQKSSPAIFYLFVFIFTDRGPSPVMMSRISSRQYKVVIIVILIAFQGLLLVVFQFEPKQSTLCHR